MIGAGTFTTSDCPICGAEDGESCVVAGMEQFSYGDAAHEERVFGSDDAGQGWSAQLVMPALIVDVDDELAWLMVRTSGL